MPTELPSVPVPANTRVATTGAQAAADLVALIEYLHANRTKLLAILDLVPQKVNGTILPADLPVATNSEIDDLASLLKPRFDKLYAVLGSSGGTTTTPPPAGATLSSLAFGGPTTITEGSTTPFPITATYTNADGTTSTSTVTDATTTISESGGIISASGTVTVPTTGVGRNVTITAAKGGKSVSKTFAVSVAASTGGEGTAPASDGGSDVAVTPFASTNIARTGNTFEPVTVTATASAVFGIKFPAGVENAFAEMTMPAGAKQNQTAHLMLKATKTEPGGPTYEQPFSFQRRYNDLQIYANGSKQTNGAGSGGVGLARYFFGTVNNVHSVQVQISTDSRATWTTIASMPSGNRDFFLAFYCEAGTETENNKLTINSLRQKGGVTV